MCTHGRMLVVHMTPPFSYLLRGRVSPEPCFISQKVNARSALAVRFNGQGVPWLETLRPVQNGDWGRACCSIVFFAINTACLIQGTEEENHAG